MNHTMNHNHNAAGGDYVALDMNVNWDFSTSFSLKIGTTSREFTVRCAEQNIIPIWATRQPAEDGGDYPYENDLHNIARDLFDDGENRWCGERFGKWTTAKEAFDAAQVLKKAFKKYLCDINITHELPREYYVQDLWEDNHAVGV